MIRSERLIFRFFERTKVFFGKGRSPDGLQFLIGALLTGFCLRVFPYTLFEVLFQFFDPFLDLVDAFVVLFVGLVLFRFVLSQSVFLGQPAGRFDGRILFGERVFGVFFKLLSPFTLGFSRLGDLLTA
jgi:hypothetical protein